MITLKVLHAAVYKGTTYNKGSKIVVKDEKEAKELLAAFGDDYLKVVENEEEGENTEDSKPKKTNKKGKKKEEEGENLGE